MVVSTDPVARASGRSVLVVVAHGDDAVLFVGGTIRLLVEAGCAVHILRFTDDATDSHGLSESETITRNLQEFEASSSILGVASTSSLNLPSDHLGDVPRTTLREAAIRAIRTVKPFAVLTFDPYSVLYEDNQDHIRIAQEVDEAFWTAMFDKHHPEHERDGLEPHGVVERWYFGRRLLEPSDRIDISAVLDVKVEATLAHVTMMDHLLHQWKLMGKTAGISEVVLDEGLRDRSSLVRTLVEGSTVEELRIVRFAGFEAVLDALPQETP